MKKKIQCIDLVYLCLGLLAIVNVFFLFFRISRGEFTFVDFRARWQESAYLFRGINPFDALSGKAYIDEIGVIDPDMVTVPWAWIWGSIISPGFLKYEYAQVWGITSFLLLAIVTSCVCYQYIRKTFEWKGDAEKNAWSPLSILIVFSQYCWVWSFMCGNHGALACCFIVIATCIYKEHPYLAGIMMTFGMIKPQVAVLFFVTFLILRQFRVVFVSIICELMTLIAVCLITGDGPIKLLERTAGVGINLNGVFYGLFNMLKYYDVSTKWILALDVVVGLIYLVVHTLLTRKYIGDSDLHIFVGAALASTFWFYKQSHDYVILIIPCLAVLNEIYKLRDEKYSNNLIILISFIVLFYVQSATRKILCKIFPSIPEYVGKELFMTLSCIFLIVLGILWLIGMKNSFTKQHDTTLT